MASMELLKKWIAQERGRGVRLAAALQVPASFVTKMASGDKPIPVEHASTIEQFTHGAVPRQAIRPADWRRIWPELADSNPNQPVAPANQAQAAIKDIAKGAAHA